MKHPSYLLPLLVLAGCATAKAPEPAPVVVPVIVVAPEPEAKPAPAEEEDLESKARAQAHARAAEIAAALAELDVATINALGGSGPPPDGVLSGNDVPAGLLDTAASSGGGSAALPPGGLQLGTGGGSRGGGIAPSGSVVGPLPPRPGVPTGWVIATSRVSGGKVDNATQVTARLRGQLRACYRVGLKQNPTLGGSLLLTAQLGPNGQVLSVSSGPTTSLLPIVPCLKAVIAGAGFAPPQGKNVAVEIALTFKPQP